MNFQIPSPCTGVCKIDEHTQTCKGCQRNIDEITRWSKMDDDEKLSVLSALINRRGLDAENEKNSTEDFVSKSPTMQDSSTDP